MALSTDQLLKLDMILNGSKEVPKALTDWETGFVSSMLERFETYGEGTLISEKQWAILDRVYDNVMIEIETQR